ncbi:hypothetical protein PMIN01_05620 [Paraphaeosphaeria minitans]|uniref:Uncharacterized protein n=1 Tax=Paraphaeosphaeria minitans TaxID=565426 RepID=A0A9P6GIQ0_9PLEO|nr:hypothetical protein PMIN01_05620 [Paraphaeosphaeria minitans]
MSALVVLRAKSHSTSFALSVRSCAGAPKRAQWSARAGGINRIIGTRTYAPVAQTKLYLDFAFLSLANVKTWELHPFRRRWRTRVRGLDCQWQRDTARIFGTIPTLRFNSP